METGIAEGLNTIFTYTGYTGFVEPFSFWVCIGLLGIGTSLLLGLTLYRLYDILLVEREMWRKDYDSLAKRYSNLQAEYGLYKNELERITKGRN